MTYYTVKDANSADYGLTYAEAVERIEEWYEDMDEWADGEGDPAAHEAIADAIASVSLPADGGGLADLQDYANNICASIAKALGGSDFCGHGRYSVSAADRLGLDLSVHEDY